MFHNLSVEIAYCFIVESHETIEYFCDDRCPGSDILGLTVYPQFREILQDAQAEPRNVRCNR